MRNRASPRWLRALEYTLLGIGIGCLTWYGAIVFEISRFQANAQVTLERMITERERGGLVRQPSEYWTGGLIGELDIPRIQLSAVIMDGDDDDILQVAVGHLSDTPLPWQPGNSALAAHRDRLFRPLERIRVDDVIQLTTPHGSFRYRVRRALVVDPEDVWVLDPLPQVNLTLITCFPFSYVGQAPRRFVVQAEKL